MVLNIKRIKSFNAFKVSCTLLHSKYSKKQVLLIEWEENGKHDTMIKSGGCCCEVAKSCTTLCDPMDCSTPGFPVLQCLPELAQTPVH